jgi:hypothetical protein
VWKASLGMRRELPVEVATPITKAVLVLVIAATNRRPGVEVWHGSDCLVWVAYSSRVTFQQNNPMPFNPGAMSAPPSAPAWGQVPGLQPGNGLLRVNIQGNVMTSNMITPKMMLDGYLIASQYGANVFQVPAGRHRLEFYAQWLRRYGQAAIDVDVPIGGAVELFYAAPLHQFTTGLVGFTKQRRKGALVFAMVMLVILVVVLMMLVLPGLD